ncbi:MAG: 3-dehydroquinate synthase [Bacilli bacterium]|nr:3-dehydroquinate synthase [Bacilli bacterium]
MKLTINCKTYSYDVIIQRNIINNVSEYLSLQRKVLILTDDGVPSEYVLKVSSQCLNPIIVTVKQGEQSKNIDNYQLVMKTLIEHGFTRTDCLVSIGGGVVGDLGGFISSTYMRGIDFYNIPTTLLSQVDSSIGGKTAIDYNGIKNIIGSFYTPKCVLIDPNTLKTLDKRQLHAGLVEAIKMACTCSSSLFEIISKSKNLENDIDEIIFQSLQIKQKIVEEDLEEKGLRRVLNFGHTLGHIIESASNYNLLHGECVGIGMLSFSSDKARKQIKKLLKKYNLPTSYDLSLKDIDEYLIHDKKKTGDYIWIVSVENIGSYELKKIKIDELYNKLKEEFHE